MSIAAPRIGSLCSGYGGLDMGVMQAVGGEVEWHIEYDTAPSKILEHHWPNVPNYGDLTALDWATLPPIDVLTAGYPCQPFSIAGKRKGADDERHLWPHIKDAIRVLRPRLVVLENVRGHLTLGFGRVIGDLAELGYVARWVCIPASAAGAPHKRERVFIVAHPGGGRLEGDAERNFRTLKPGLAPSQRVHADGLGDSPQDSDCATRDQRGISAPGQAQSGRSRPDAGRRSGTSATDPGRGEPKRRGVHSRVVETPGRSESADRERQRHGDAADDRGAADWREYAPAIHRWEHVIGRVAPAPTLADGRAGNHRLSARFVEWMMGLPEGHVTNPAIGLTRAQQLKALGNGVVPQQAALALRLLLEGESL